MRPRGDGAGGTADAGGDVPGLVYDGPPQGMEVVEDSPLEMVLAGREWFDTEHGAERGRLVESGCPAGTITTRD